VISFILWSQNKSYYSRYLTSTGKDAGNWTSFNRRTTVMCYRLLGRRSPASNWFRQLCHLSRNIAVSRSIWERWW